jgi:hypothetical protein
MRADQRVKLAELEEKLADVFLSEADPVAWPGHGKASGELTSEDRAQRYQHKRAAAETAMLLARTQSLMDGGGGPGGAGEEAGLKTLDRQIDRAEKEAAKALERIQSGAGKAALEQRTNGRKA